MSGPKTLFQRLWLSLPSSLRQNNLSFKTVRRKGTSHDHIRLIGNGLIARIPKHCPPEKTPHQALSIQADRFRYSSHSRHVPELYAVLPPSTTLPFGALLVSDILGRPPRSGADLQAIAKALASLHTLPSPSYLTLNPLSSTLSLISQRWPYLSRFSPETLSLVRDEFNRVVDLSSTLIAQYPLPLSWSGNDAHPANFLIDPQGKAWFVDLEKADFSLPALDLAHTTLYTSTLWAINALFSRRQIARFYHTWEETVPSPLAKKTRPWFQIGRRLIWIRTLSWMAQWLYTADLSLFSPSVRDRLTRRIHQCFSPDTIRQFKQDL